MTPKPTQNEVIDLIDRAKSHELGVDFLTNGALDAVAMTFGVHAFVVDAARDELAKPEISVEHKETISV
jgi:hypothetical protein